MLCAVFYIVKNLSNDFHNTKANYEQKDNINNEEIEEVKKIEKQIQKKEDIEEINEIINYPNEDTSIELSFVVLGEIMMGGNVHKSLSGSYTNAFKEIAEYTKNVDYVVANLTTNITNLEKYENPKTKYIVTKKIVNSFNALGINAVNIANDHAIDFGQAMFNTTKSILQNEELDIIGLEKEIVYAESNGIRVAFIGICNEVIGMQYYYEKAGIFMYNMDKIKAKIKEAKERADTVVVMGHLGLENQHKITSIMNWYYKALINAGADIVLGAHALGMYPIEIYKGKPIIYSLGYFIHDTNYEIGKEAGIFKFTIDVSGTIKQIEIIPTYIKDKKTVVPYYNYNKTKAEALLKKLAKDIEDDNKEIKNEKLFITINN